MSLYQFTVDDLRARYGCESDTELSRLLGVSKAAVSIWRSNGVPAGFQRFLNVESHTPESRKKMPQSA